MWTDQQENGDLSNLTEEILNGELLKFYAVCIPVFILYLGISLPDKLKYSHCLKSVRSWSFSGLYFPAFGLNTEIYSEKYSVRM